MSAPFMMPVSIMITASSPTSRTTSGSRWNGIGAVVLVPELDRGLLHQIEGVDEAGSRDDAGIGLGRRCILRRTLTSSRTVSATRSSSLVFTSIQSDLETS